jgi:hypothetical protein
MNTKPDLVCGAIGRLQWPQIRPWVLSLQQSRFKGDIVLFAAAMDPFVLICLRSRGVHVVPFDIPAFTSPWEFVSKMRYVPVLKFLAQHRADYRHILWADVSDIIFQSNPSTWMAQHISGPTIVASRVCWRIGDETTFNRGSAAYAFPDGFHWLQHQELFCGGTLAGTPDALFDVLNKVFAITSEHPGYADQAVLNYVLHTPNNFPASVRIYAPPMRAGWTAVCSAFKEIGFYSTIGPAESLLTDEAPIFNQKRGLVLTPDGKTPFVLIHQYDRDPWWKRFITKKYEWD